MERLMTSDDIRHAKGLEPREGLCLVDALARWSPGEIHLVMPLVKPSSHQGAIILAQSPAQADDSDL